MNMFNIFFIVTFITSSLYFNVAEAGVSATTFKNKMLSHHNTLRQKTAKGNTPGQPAAKYMKTLKWDSKLASVAKAWSQKCQWSHNTQAGSQYGKKSVAENMYASTYGETINNLLMSVTAWYNEYKTYNFQNGVHTATTHYAIMMNADTTKIGCGYTMCPQLSGSSLQGNNKKMVVVCDYYPSGGNGSPYLQKGSSFTADEEEVDGSTLSSTETAAVVLCSVGCICFVIIAGLLYMRKRKRNMMKEEVDDFEKDDDDKKRDTLSVTTATPLPENNDGNGDMAATPASDDNEESPEIEVDAYHETR